jgi:hypothetical protein
LRLLLQGFQQRLQGGVCGHGLGQLLAQHAGQLPVVRGGVDNAAGSRSGQTVLSRCTRLLKEAMLASREPAAHTRPLSKQSTSKEHSPP